MLGQDLPTTGRMSVSALSAGAFITTLDTLIDIVKGGRHSQ
jgi:hypothetical protein